MINIVLYQPEKPQNTGNIMRTCMAWNMKLHIIGPLTFRIDDKSLQRAGMDYLKAVDYTIYDSYQDFLDKNDVKTMYFVTRYGDKTPDKMSFVTGNDYYIMFGKESTGIPKHILKSDMENCYRIPMVESARSLNLSNCVALCAYEAYRQLNYEGLSRVEVIKGEDFLSNYEGED